MVCWRVNRLSSPLSWETRVRTLPAEFGWRLAIRFAFQAAVGEPAEAGDSGGCLEVSEPCGDWPAGGSIRRHSAGEAKNVTLGRRSG